MKEPTNILEKDNKNFFDFKQVLKNNNIKSEYFDYQYLIIDYKGNKYILTSIENATPEPTDIIINNKYVLGLK